MLLKDLLVVYKGNYSVKFYAPTSDRQFAGFTCEESNILLTGCNYVYTCVLSYDETLGDVSLFDWSVFYIDLSSDYLIIWLQYPDELLTVESQSPVLDSDLPFVEVKSASRPISSEIVLDTISGNLLDTLNVLNNAGYDYRVTVDCTPEQLGGMDLYVSGWRWYHNSWDNKGGYVVDDFTCLPFDQILRLLQCPVCDLSFDEVAGFYIVVLDAEQFLQAIEPYRVLIV